MELSIQEFPLENKKMISKDKSTISEKNIQHIDLSKILEVESTTKEEDFDPWLIPYYKELSQKLWLPTRTDCVASDSNLLSSSANDTIPTSWFSITRNCPKNKKWFKISYPSLQSSPAGVMVLESTNRKSKKILKHKKKSKHKRKKKSVDGLHRSYEFRLFPTPKQRLILRQWLGTARYCYNQIIAKHKKDKNIPLTYTTRDETIKEIPFDHKQVNLEIKKNAIQEAFNTISAGGDNFEFRSRKSKSESVYVRQGCVSTVQNTIFPRTFGKNTDVGPISLKGKTLFKPELDGSKLIRRGDKYYLHIVKIKKQPEIIFKEKGSSRNTICALDPGTHTFMDYYSNLDCGKIGSEAGAHVIRHCLRIDKMISKSTTLNSRKRYKLKKAILRSREKLKNKVTELHWKTASFLCDHYDHIFLSHFETSNMAQKQRRKIKSKTVRKMLTLSHFLFSQRLISKAEEKGTVVYKLQEPYTSQLCGNCHLMNKGLKLSDREYKCKHCNIKIDRDYNGARNILLRGLTLLNEQGLISLRWEIPPFQRQNVVGLYGSKMDYYEL